MNTTDKVCERCGDSPFGGNRFCKKCGYIVLKELREAGYIYDSPDHSKQHSEQRGRKGRNWTMLGGTSEQRDDDDND